MYVTCTCLLTDCVAFTETDTEASNIAWVNTISNIQGVLRKGSTAVDSIIY